VTERLRIHFFVVALVALAFAVLLELGSLLFVQSPQDEPPGLGIAYMALVDGPLLFTVALMALALVIRENLQGRIQGIATLIFSIVIIIAGIVMIIFAIAALLLMVGLLLAIPFGPLAYAALGFASFPRGTASTFLSLIMLLKIVFAICLVLAELRFLQMRGLVVTILLSFVANIVVSFLQGFPPGFLVSVTDAIAAIIVGIVGVILAIVMLVFAVVAVIRIIRINRDLTGSQGS